MLRQKSADLNGVIEKLVRLLATVFGNPGHFLQFFMIILRFHKKSVQTDMQKTRENASATIKYAMSEVMQIQFFETQNYPFSACISDTGGAAGLFLGLNAIGKLPLYVSLRHLCHKIFFGQIKRYF